MKKIHVTFDTYSDMCERLGKQIRKEKKHYDCVVAVARGGLLVGDILSRMLKCPMAVISASSYQGERAGKVLMSEVATTDPSHLLGDILLVDDLMDSGATLDCIQRKLKDAYHPRSIDIAVLWHKHTSKVYPDFCVKYFDESENGWIVQPFEEFEER